MVGTVVFHDLDTYEFYTYSGQENDIICYGDSGGPTFHEIQDGVEVMLGINGTGGAACTEGGVSASYRLDTESAQEWIEAQLSTYD
jgi:secreted trypsin-like serine protease